MVESLLANNTTITIGYQVMKYTFYMNSILQLRGLKQTVFVFHVCGSLVPIVMVLSTGQERMSSSEMTMRFMTKKMLCVVMLSFVLWLITNFILCEAAVSILQCKMMMVCQRFTVTIMGNL